MMNHDYINKIINDAKQDADSAFGNDFVNRCMRLEKVIVQAEKEFIEKLCEEDQDVTAVQLARLSTTVISSQLAKSIVASTIQEWAANGNKDYSVEATNKELSQISHALVKGCQEVLEEEVPKMLKDAFNKMLNDN